MPFKFARAVFTADFCPNSMALRACTTLSRHAKLSPGAAFPSQTVLRCSESHWLSVFRLEHQCLCRGLVVIDLHQTTACVRHASPFKSVSQPTALSRNQQPQPWARRRLSMSSCGKYHPDATGQTHACKQADTFVRTWVAPSQRGHQLVHCTEELVHGLVCRPAPARAPARPSTPRPAAPPWPAAHPGPRRRSCGPHAERRVSRRAGYCISGLHRPLPGPTRPARYTSPLGESASSSDICMVRSHWPGRAARRKGRGRAAALSGCSTTVTTLTCRAPRRRRRRDRSPGAPARTGPASARGCPSPGAAATTDSPRQSKAVRWVGWEHTRRRWLRIRQLVSVYPAASPTRHRRAHGRAKGVTLSACRPQAGHELWR